MRVRGVHDHPRSLALGQARLGMSRRICWKARIRRLLLVKVVSVREIQRGRRISVLQVSLFCWRRCSRVVSFRFRTWADRSAKRSEANTRAKTEPCPAQNIPLVHFPGTSISHPFVVHRCTLESPSASSGLWCCCRRPSAPTSAALFDWVSRVSTTRISVPQLCSALRPWTAQKTRIPTIGRTEPNRLRTPQTQQRETRRMIGSTSWLHQHPLGSQTTSGISCCCSVTWMGVVLHSSHIPTCFSCQHAFL